MTHSRFEQTRIQQLVSPYAPDAPPRLPLDFGDYLSLLWRIDHHADSAKRARYYRQCATALGMALELPSVLMRVVESTPSGGVTTQITNLPYRGDRLVDAPDRKAAIVQLMQIRDDTLRIGTYQESWNNSYPGSGIEDVELRERTFAILFTALQGQYSNFGRLLLVVDIVLSDLLIGMGASAAEFALHELISDYNYPDPNDARVKKDYAL